MFVHGVRPKFMKDAIAAIKDDPATVLIEATSFFGKDYEGAADNMPVDQTIYIAGPDPETNRKWYLNVTRKADGTYEFNK